MNDLECLMRDPIFPISAKYNFEIQLIEDYSILPINRKVNSYLKQEKKLLPELTKELEDLDKMIQTRQYIKERLNCINRIEKIKNAIKLIKEEYRIKNYESKTKPLIEQYIEAKKTENKDLLIDAIEKFFNCCSEYFPVKIQKKYEINNNVCYSCSNSIENLYQDDNGIQQCMNCSVLIENSQKYKINKDESVGCYSSKISDTLNNMRILFVKYQGEYELPNMDKIEESIDSYLLEDTSCTSADIRKLPLNENRKRGNINYRTLRCILQKLKMQDYYADAWLIGKEVFGWVLDDINYLKEDFESMFIKTETYMLSLSKEERGRSSSMNLHDRMYKQLTDLGHTNHLEEDFNIPQNEKSKRVHKELWEKTRKACYPEK